MRTRQILLGIALILTTSVAAASAQPSTNEDRAAAWLEAHRPRPVMLRMFLQRMPKGGDIHTHLSGAVYAESYIAWAASAGLCAGTATGAIGPCSALAPEARPVAEALRDPVFYSLIVDGLSTRNVANRPQSGHDQFFDAFSRFRAATKDRSADMVAELATRAADQHVMYLEIMLTLGLVPPADLRFHIREAVEVAKARRIGHGVDIAYERDAMQLLAEMKRRDVLVEICLTSNDVILGVRGPRHPFPDYLLAGVPVTLATDDEGVSRIDLTNEYVRAAETYGLGYRQLKQLSRNSLTYSFLAGDSLWRSASDAQPVAVCGGARPDQPPPSPCQSFLDASDKARMQWNLERAFHAFEGMGWSGETR